MYRNHSFPFRIRVGSKLDSMVKVTSCLRAFLDKLFLLLLPIRIFSLGKPIVCIQRKMATMYHHKESSRLCVVTEDVV